MKKQNKMSRKRRYLDALGVWSLNGFEHGFEEKPIRVKVGNKRLILQPTNPMYQVTKWYGEYEEL